MLTISGLRDLGPRYDAILCDVWGVVHNGRQHFAAACDALTRFRVGGGVVVLVSNPTPPSAFSSTGSACHAPLLTIS